MGVKIYCLAETKNSINVFPYFLYLFPSICPSTFSSTQLSSYLWFLNSFSPTIQLCLPSAHLIKPRVSEWILLFHLDFKILFNLYFTPPFPSSCQRKKKAFSFSLFLWNFSLLQGIVQMISLLSIYSNLPPFLISHVTLNYHFFEFLQNFECIIIVVTTFSSHSIVIYMADTSINCKIFEVKDHLPL